MLPGPLMPGAGDFLGRFPCLQIGSQRRPERCHLGCCGGLCGTGGSSWWRKLGMPSASTRRKTKETSLESMELSVYSSSLDWVSALVKSPSVVMAWQYSVIALARIQRIVGALWVANLGMVASGGWSQRKVHRMALILLAMPLPSAQQWPWKAAHFLRTLRMPGRLVGICCGPLSSFLLWLLLIWSRPLYWLVRLCCFLCLARSWTNHGMKAISK